MLRKSLRALVVFSIATHPLVSRGEAPQEFEALDVRIVVSEAFPHKSRPSLLVHFHGAPQTVEQNFRRSGLSGALVIVNCQGLSSAYRRPFENQDLFPYLLSYVGKQLELQHQLPADAGCGRIDLSCFSAGYGAVREILKHEEQVATVQAVVAADSIYASIHQEDGQRIVDAEQMQPFLDFARQAIRGDKTFLMSYSQLPVEAYASTSETAHYLLQQTGVAERSIGAPMDGAFRIQSMATQGGLMIAGFPGADGDAHLEHLRQIQMIWSWLRERRSGRDPVELSQVIEQGRGALSDGGTGK